MQNYDEDPEHEAETRRLGAVGMPKASGGEIIVLTMIDAVDGWRRGLFRTCDFN
jgi:hypothetical protein